MNDRPMTAAEAFDETRPLPQSALAALDYMNRKDAALQAAESLLGEFVEHVGVSCSVEPCADGDCSKCQPPPPACGECLVCRARAFLTLPYTSMRTSNEPEQTP